MATLRQIYITFLDARAQADKLDDCASQLRRERARLESNIQSLRAGWDGDTARQYQAKCQLMMEKLARTADNLEQIAGVIRRSAQAYYDAEKRNLQIIAANGVGLGGR